MHKNRLPPRVAGTAQRRRGRSRGHPRFGRGNKMLRPIGSKARRVDHREVRLCVTRGGMIQDRPQRSHAPSPPHLSIARCCRSPSRCSRSYGPSDCAKPSILVGRAGRRAASFYAGANRRPCPFAEPEEVLANYLAGAVKTLSCDSSLVRQKHVIFDGRSGAAEEPPTHLGVLTDDCREGSCDSDLIHGQTAIISCLVTVLQCT